MARFTHDDEHGSRHDYWDEYPTDSYFDVDPDETPFLLTDAELDAMSEDIDELPPVEADWFAPAGLEPF